MPFGDQHNRTEGRHTYYFLGRPSVQRVDGARAIGALKVTATGTLQVCRVSAAARKTPSCFLKHFPESSFGKAYRRTMSLILPPLLSEAVVVFRCESRAHSPPCAWSYSRPLEVFKYSNRTELTFQKLTVRSGSDGGLPKLKAKRSQAKVESSTAVQRKLAGNCTKTLSKPC